jgi:arabinan endo-1,5-alpha-L-arabinosidase
MTMVHRFRSLMCLGTSLVCVAMQPDHETSQAVKVPRIVGEYTTVYRPTGQRFPGPSTAELEAGRRYEDWVPNDHTLIKGPDGRWNMFGITHPLTSLKAVHEGEFQSFHASAPAGLLKEVLGENTWQDMPTVLRAVDRAGERPELYAPYVVQSDGLFYMFYGPNPIRLATSPDLKTWTLEGPVFSDAPSSRDPSVSYWQSVYTMVYCSENRVVIRTSGDLRHWGAPQTIMRMNGATAPESPSIIRQGDVFYLFVCIWNEGRDKKTMRDSYQHKTYVYRSSDLLQFQADKEITILDAHAPEVFQGEDGKWYISSAEWPRRGVSIARLNWE